MDAEGNVVIQGHQLWLSVGRWATFTSDAQGRLLWQETRRWNGELNRTTYDSAGDEVSSVTTSLLGNLVQRSTFTYDGYHQQLTFEHEMQSEHTRSTYAYDADGLLSVEVYGNDKGACFMNTSRWDPDGIYIRDGRRLSGEITELSADAAGWPCAFGGH